MESFSNLIQLQRYFNNELACVHYLEKLKWNGKPVCPKCGCEKLYRIPTRLKNPDLEDYKDYQCSNRSCKKMFSILTDSVFSGSKVSLQTWFSAMYLISAHKKGISSHQLARDLGITQKTAWFILHRVRASYTPELPASPKDGLFMADELFVGGEEKNKHAEKKTEGTQGRSVKTKTPVFGIMQKGGKIYTEVVPDTKSTTLKPIIKQLVKDGAIIVTDEWLGYSGLSRDYDHIVINHNTKEYVRGAFTVNNVENFWSILARGIYGIYHHVSPKHLHRYCNEFSYRYNMRRNSDIAKFNAAVFLSKGKRLTYNQLISEPPDDDIEDAEFDMFEIFER